MNPFHDICVRAKQGSLTRHPLASYLASDAFRERVNFKGEQGRQDSVNAMLFMLKSVALRPGLKLSAYEVDPDYVFPEFFGVSNPIPPFSVTRGSAEHIALQEAVDANRASRMTRAAMRMTYWRNRSAKRSSHEDSVLRHYRTTLDFPTPEDYRKDREAALKRHYDTVPLINQKLQHLRNVRNSRLARLSAAAYPGCQNWLDYLLNIAQAALSPKLEQQAA